MAADGIEAFELYKRRLPDLVLLDLNMPRQNGWATFEKISEFNPLTPIIIITGRPDQSGSAAVARVGALMEKPFDVPLLIEVVQQLIEEAHPQTDSPAVTRLPSRNLSRLRRRTPIVASHGRDQNVFRTEWRR